MSEKHTIARQNYWASFTAEERSARMKEIAKKRQKAMTFKEKRDHALKMVAARMAKKAGKRVV